MNGENRPTRGADRRTPSIPQYFSWINNTWEGSTERQTLVNLDFFAWLKKTYGMQIGIYLWDAGNFDGPSSGYGDPDSEKFRSQYPNGFGPLAERAAELGIRMGLWCGPDGFGDTPEEEKKRYDFLLGLCRKYRFALFKIDSACGGLRPEKAAVYAKLLTECREYCPDLVVLNHRLELHEAEKVVTTFLWQGVETYADVHSSNKETCMHHRGFIFKRGLPDGLERLAEDHGVCISSSVAYFEDDLIYQAFGRSMIMAPEIYGNPWLMRDDEFPRLARIYNLHRRAAPILVDGIVLPASYGDNPVSRGSGSHRFLATGHHGWTPLKIRIALNEEIGLEPTGEKIALIERHPAESLVGIYDYGDTVERELLPFRTHLYEIAPVGEAYPVLENCAYRVIREDEAGRPTEIETLFCEGGAVTLLDGGKRTPFGTSEKTDIREGAPVWLGKIDERTDPGGRAEELFEAAQFAADNDSLEARERKRAGETAVPEVKAARDAFFSQTAYRLRGCESSAMFDGDPGTFFDGWSKTFLGGQRVNGGCLRVDFGEVFDADAVEIDCFSVHTPIREIPAQSIPGKGSFSADRRSWKETEEAETSVQSADWEEGAIREGSYLPETVRGDMLTAVYRLDGSGIRYFRLPCPPDRIHAVRLMKDGEAVALKNPRANNLQPPFETKRPVELLEKTLRLPEAKDGDTLALALNGIHGEEGAYCTAEIDGEPIGFPDRAPAFRANMWEYQVTHSDRNYTYYLPLKKGLSGREIKIRVLLCDREHTEIDAEAWLCPRH